MKPSRKSYQTTPPMLPLVRAFSVGVTRGLITAARTGIEGHPRQTRTQPIEAPRSAAASREEPSRIAAADSAARWRREARGRTRAPAPDAASATDSQRAVAPARENTHKRAVAVRRFPV